MTGENAERSSDRSIQGSDPPLAFRTKSQLAYEQLRRWIVFGRLEPGQRLDQEWLAASLQVSRMPLRQALLRLEADGLIQNRPHRSAVVAPLSLAEIRDIYATRRALEGMLAEEGAAACDDRCLASMAAAVDVQEAAVAEGDLERFVEADRRFHFTLYEASRFVRACEMAERLRDMADRYIWFYARYRRGAAQSIDEHRSILGRCRDHQATTVRRLTERHIDQGLAVLTELASAADAGAPPPLGEGVPGNAGGPR